MKPEDISGTILRTGKKISKILPPKVREGFIRVGHAVGVKFLLDGVADFSVGVDDFGGEFGGESVVGTVTSGASGFNNPADGEGLFALVSDRSWDLVAGATNTAGADLHLGFKNFQSFPAIGQLVILGLFFN